MKQYALFVGRFRTFHDGHLWLVENKLREGPVWIMVRPTDEQPPAETRKSFIEARLTEAGWSDFKVTVLEDDIESINYGRGVGYAVNYWMPPDEIAQISSTSFLGG